MWHLYMFVHVRNTKSNIKSLTDAVQIASKFPALNDYEEMWPLDCIIISLLKYHASQNKSSSMKKTVESMQNTIA